MNSDIRLSTSFFGHRKTKKLRKRCGEAGIISLLKLWVYVAENNPSGLLSGWKPEDVELSGEWGGDDGIFCKAIVDVKFLTENGDGFRVHDWEDHNPYAAGAVERSNKARFSKLKQAYPKLYEQLLEKGYGAITSSDYKEKVEKHLVSIQRNASEPLGDSQRIGSETPAPSPSPSPSPKVFLSDSIEYRLADYLKKWLLKNNPNAKAKNCDMQKWSKQIDYMIRIDKRNPDEIKEVIKFCQTDSFWLKNILSTAKLRDQYDQLFIKMKPPNITYSAGKSDANKTKRMLDDKLK